MSTTGTEVDVKRVFALQKDNQPRILATGAEERIRKLKRLAGAIERRTPDLLEVLRADLGRPATEAILTEIFPVATEIRHACRNLRKWMRPVRVSAPLVFLGSRNEIRYQPKGVVLVMAPWNFPFQLAVGPLVSAIAAGNSIVLKPSELSEHTSRFLRELVADIFDEPEVTVIEGDATVAQALLELPFDHVFFTGSPAIGKVVMAAAAKNLTSVTLELGGKCPVMVDASADLASVARKVAWGKFVNAGQICLAPDYVLVPQERVGAFAGELRRFVEKQYGSLDALASNPDYGRIINDRHWRRLKELFDSAIGRGARVALGGVFGPSRFISPTVLTDVPLDSDLMQDEIFGPLLPIVGYRDLDEAIRVINERPRPLALYVFGRDRGMTERLLTDVPAGDTVVNDVLVHFANVALPFGGQRTSGLGKSHGYHGFKAFSHERGVMTQPRRTLMEIFYPPYTERARKLASLVSRHL